MLFFRLLSANGFELISLAERRLSRRGLLKRQVVLHHAFAHDYASLGFLGHPGTLQVLMGHGELRHELACSLQFTVSTASAPAVAH